MPVVDLSGPLAQQLQRALEQARKLREEQNYAAAAQSYRRCAQLQTQLAEYAVNKAVKLQQLQVARTYLEVAERLERQGSGAQVEAAAEDFQGQIASLITRATVTWDDIGNLQSCKEAIQAAYAFALVRRPAAIVRSPVSKVLLYGPPGTGKTMLAAAASHELDATFFSVKASDLLSKWFGESSRLISALYREAARRAPSVVFLEEFDALAPHRSESDSGAERRIVSTLLAELDGLTGAADRGRYVLTIAATNLPWAIDRAILERFGARLIYVPLPDAAARAEILRKQLDDRGYTSAVPLDELVARTEGFSGRDLANLCSVAIERMEIENNPEVLALLVAQGREALQNHELRIAPVTAAHLDHAFAQVTPRTTHEEVRRYEEWRVE